MSEKIELLAGMIRERQRLRFSELFEAANHRSEVIVTFLALLELIRMKQIRIEQSEAFADIEISPALPPPPPLPAEGEGESEVAQGSSAESMPTGGTPSQSA